MTSLDGRLGGRVVAYLEARMRSEMGSLIERHGGVPYSAPVLQENYLADSPDVRQLIDDVCLGKLDVVVLLTGVGTRALVEAAGTMGAAGRVPDSPGPPDDYRPQPQTGPGAAPE